MEEKTVQREDVLGEAIQILEIEGIANTTLEMVAERVAYPLNDLKRFWPDQEALLYDALRYLSHQVDAWRRQLLLDESLSAEQKLLARYAALTTCVSNHRYPGCLFIAACTFIRTLSIRSISWPSSKSRLRWPIPMNCLASSKLTIRQWSQSRWS